MFATTPQFLPQHHQQRQQVIHHRDLRVSGQGGRVSRSWLYTQPDIRAEVLRLRDFGRRAPGTSVPAHHRSSDASLLRRLQATTPATGN